MTRTQLRNAAIPLVVSIQLGTSMGWKSGPQNACTSAINTKDRPTVTSTCSMCRR